jgi:hypothetical protein
MKSTSVLMVDAVFKLCEKYGKEIVRTREGAGVVPGKCFRNSVNHSTSSIPES